MAQKQIIRGARSNKRVAGVQNHKVDRFKEENAMGGGRGGTAIASSMREGVTLRAPISECSGGEYKIRSHGKKTKNSPKANMLQKPLKN